MSSKVICPQCQLLMAVPEPLKPGKGVRCPKCQLKFVPPQGSTVAAGAAPTQSGNPVPIIVTVLLIVALAVGGVVWNQLRSQPTDSGALAQNKSAADKANGAAPPKVEPNTTQEAQPSTPVNEPTPEPMKVPMKTPVKQPSVDDDLPDVPVTTPKKAPPKSYVETKQPVVNEPPVNPTPEKTPVKEGPQTTKDDKPAAKNDKPAVKDDKPATKEDPPAPTQVAVSFKHPRQKEINEAIDKGVAYLKKSGGGGGLNLPILGPNPLGGQNPGLVPANPGVQPNPGGLLPNPGLVPPKIGQPPLNPGGAAPNPGGLLPNPGGNQLNPGAGRPGGVLPNPGLVGQNPLGFGGIQHPLAVGYACMRGLTLLECGVPKNDPAVQEIAKFVRSGPTIDRALRTYQLATAVLFLDRLGDPQDKVKIQSCALMLIAGQSPRGSWGYETPDMQGPELQKLYEFLDATRVATPDKKKTGGRPVPAAKSLPGIVPHIPIVHHYYTGQMPTQPLTLMRDDNSNTQFAILALWAARRHGVATERSLILAAQRLQASQLDDGGWPYQPDGIGGETGSKPAMTCVGLLGMAMGAGLVPAAKDNGKLTDNPVIEKGLNKLGEHVDPKELTNFYFLWSMERVGVLYKLRTLGKRDWYDVGVELLLPAQKKEGSWFTQGYTGATEEIDTCFALLFLKRSNLVQDLTERLPLLMTISDPGERPNR